MHELGLTEQILEIALRHGKEHEAERITDLYLVIGELSSVIDESVRFYWDMIAGDTLCEGAELHFERIPAELECRACGRRYGLEDGQISACPDCGSTRIKVLQGKEFQLQSINIDS